ncbi:MAG: hypothetical protein SNJ29_13500, partial [Rikenellaceae bacterium]
RSAGCNKVAKTKGCGGPELNTSETLTFFALYRCRSTCLRSAFHLSPHPKIYSALHITFSFFGGELQIAI